MKTPNTDALLPCPFCGGEPDEYDYAECNGALGDDVCCVTDGCVVEGCVVTREKWNTRTPAPSVSSEELEIEALIWRRLVPSVQANLGMKETAKRIKEDILTAFHVSKKEG